MIELIKVDGFRSLQKFKFKISPGLNVIVGTNGSGKTNFIDFLEFLSVFAQEGLASAIANSGGTNSVFSQEQLKLNSKKQQLSLQVCGQSKFEARFRRSVDKKTDPTEVQYRYECSIALVPQSSLLLITEEVILIREASKGFNVESAEYEDFDIWLKVTRSANEDGASAKVEIKEVKQSTLKRYFVPRLLIQNKQNESLGSSLEALLSAEPPYTSIFGLQVSYYAEAIATLRRQLINGYSYNISPTKAKISDDLASQPGIRRDGAGLSATLYFLKLESTRRKSADLVHRFHKWMGSGSFQKAFEQIVSLTKAINVDFHSISTELDVKLGKYISYITFKAGKSKEITIPLSAASDGTIKWISLVTALSTGAPIVAIEEPENFLHPAMQRDFIDFVRSLYQSTSHSNRFIVISTHSETLLNCCDPTELIVARYENGRTKLSRPSNLDAICDAMETSGFGLGYFVVNDAVR